jgi:membrane-bound lytic murein transglycosylase D
MTTRSPLLVLALTVVLGACASGSLPVPQAPLPEPVVVEPETLGEGPEIEEVVVAEVEPSLLGNVSYDLPVVANTWVEAELWFLVDERPHVIERWMERGDFYEPFIKQVLEQHGLPTDLFHLAMIESGFIPSARSRAGAVGLWQFMPVTARAVGLRVDREVDERMDPVRSTYAAARHLQWLYRSFGGDWALAAAAYNAGSGRISRGLQGFGVDNFWDLATLGDLADETRHYVPRLYAMTIVARDRARFGFTPPPSEWTGFVVDTVAVDLATPLAELARLGENVSVDELTRLNPHLLQRATPDGTYQVWVPVGQGAPLQQAFLDSEFRRGGGFGVYVVRRGDSLSRIAQLSGLPATRIRELNPRVNWDRLQIGHRVRLPAGAARAIAARTETPAATVAVATPSSHGGSGSAPAGAVAAASSNGANGGTHRIRSGETLWAISRRYGVTVADLQSANGLNGSTIVPGRTLVIPGTEAGSRSSETSWASTAEHVVKPGETLWGIARGYSSSVAEIQRLNRLKTSTIRPGDTLLVPR